MDFRIARMMSTLEIAEEEITIGTPDSMSPEQMDREKKDQRMTDMPWAEKVVLRK